MRYEFSLDSLLKDNPNVPSAFVILLFFRVIAFYITQTYAGIIRYTSSQDAVRIALAVGSSSIVVLILNLVYQYYTHISILPNSVIIIDMFITVMVMTSFRLGYKLIFQQVKNASISRTNVIIYGAGQLGMITKRTLDHDHNLSYKVVGFLENDRTKVNKYLEGVKIHHEDELDNLLSKGNIQQVIISIQNFSKEAKRKVIETCLEHNVKVLTIPPVNKWINGELNIKQIKNVKIEDLLGRDAIELDNALVNQELRNKVILVTGAAGSIGSEISRQLMTLQPDLLIMVDQAETPLYELEYEFKNDLKYDNIKHAVFVVGDIRNENTMREIFKKYKPNKVFHAAAYKHVPLMEANPAEALKNNVLGTRNLADLSVEFGVNKFVMVSTDKAVNPTNVMGASKRIAEIYVQSLNKHLKNKSHQNHTRFITTRFGNVLGSNGSVIPLFKKQIENGGPITITHKDITRYFMTIPEACQLVLEAGAMGKGGEIFIFDMGEPVRIVDLAKKMVKLSGLELEKDIHITYSGLRPGEKIFEELLNDSENTMATHHPKIMIAKVREYAYEEVNDKINDLIITAHTNNHDEDVVRHMKQLVPEFLSNNSVFSVLDEAK
ncbi:MAG: nucleoside-diphosphate sugar epimerase/dehydratase [Bacteroidota bacterium]|nr:nucleoside-diphosphate sugar epimerase/dehydratase [Bacteroidota bacterium]